MPDTKFYHPSRRAILKTAGSSSFAVALGMPIPFSRFLPDGLTPIALAQSMDPLVAKPGLSLLNDRPVNMETPPHLLDDDVTPPTRFFVRNNGIPPVLDKEAVQNWRLVVDGEVETSLDLSIAELKTKFEQVTLQLQIECGGNGRKYFNPGASGNQWTFGAVGCPEWTGVRLRDVLNAAGLKSNAVYTAHFGADSHLSGDADKNPLSRGVPIEKALDENNLIAWAMGGQPLPGLNGFPLRLVVPGWPGSCSQKWLTKITIRDGVHDGAKMTGKSYRMPVYPVAPGTEVPEEDMVVIQSMPVKSLITAPQTGMRIEQGEILELRGSAWAGDSKVVAVDISVDFGATWQSAELMPLANRFAWHRWRTKVELPAAGYYEVWARATDDENRMQPATTPGWNPKGYLNNMQHRVAIFVV